MELTNIPDPDCYKCDGVGWYEGGECIMTNCSCLKTVAVEEAEKYVYCGSMQNWRDLYVSKVS